MVCGTLIVYSFLVTAGLQNLVAGSSNLPDVHEDLSHVPRSLSVSEILDNGTQAPGGQKALQSLKTVSSHALHVVYPY